MYSVTSGDQEMESKDDNETQENVSCIAHVYESLKGELILQAENTEAPPRMRSNRFFILHVLFNTILMFCVSSFLFTTSENLDSNSDDALVIPQILGVVPGQDPG